MAWRGGLGEKQVRINLGQGDGVRPGDRYRASQYSDRLNPDSVAPRTTIPGATMVSPIESNRNASTSQFSAGDRGG